uniref:Uncharacterized protein n=1 Tax=Anguilla anguilla TaxID=7936 RepID=A0A0E9RYK5_ANGAN
MCITNMCIVVENKYTPHPESECALAFHPFSKCSWQ